jgi:cytochrome c553
VVASDFGLGADVGMRTAPGGTFSVDTTGVRAFACSNCHDPHGRFRLQFNDGVSFQWAGPNPTTGLVAISQPIFASSSYGTAPTALGAVGAYRLLAGTGYLPASMVTGAFPFVNNPPVAVAPANYNRIETGASTATNQVRVAYGAGMSEWCQNCHTNIHLDNYTSGALGGVGLRHPAGTGAILKPGQVTVYNSYVSSGVFSSVAADRYNSLVPFENAKKLGLDAAAVGVVPATAITALRTAATAGVDANIFAKADDANVMCLSCHRAHASAFPAMVRWNNDDTFITNSTVFTNTGGRADMSVAYYGRTKADFGNYQRSMCNKCHGKD